MRSGGRTWVWAVGIAAAIVLWVCAGAGAEESVTLRKADGTSIVVRGEGGAGGDSALATAARIAAFDVELKQGKPPAGNVSAANAEVVRAMEQIAAEQREVAVETLDRAIKIANRTAGGVDKGLLKSANDALESARSVMRTPPPGSLYVRTEIAVARPQWVLHYQSAAEYKRNEESWHSYDFGEKLRIGRYVFRASPGDAETREYRETILVLADPTALKLQPVNAK